MMNVIHICLIITIAIGHYCFSCQRHLYHVAREFSIPQAHLDVLMSGWVLVAQVLSSIAKFGLIIYLGFVDSWGNAVIWFLGAMAVHIFAPILPTEFFMRMYFEKAEFIKNFDFMAGSELQRLLKKSRYLNR